MALMIRSEPVFIMTVATSCAGMSVHIERMTAMSSTCSPIFGNTSLSSMPDWPFFANVNGDRIATPLIPVQRLPIVFRQSPVWGQRCRCARVRPAQRYGQRVLPSAGKGGALGVSEEKISGGLERFEGRSVVVRTDWPGPAHQFPSQTDWRNWRRV